MDEIDADLIRRHGAALQARRIDPTRAAELADELVPMQAAIAAFAATLDFDDQPADYPRIMLAAAAGPEVGS